MQAEPETIVLSERTQPEPQNEERTYKILFPVVASGFSFFIAGINDGCLGALLPYIMEDYHIGTNLVTVVYAATFLGWLFAALTNVSLCQYLGLGSMLSLGAILQVIAHALRVWKPPFALFTITFFLVSLGQAFNDMHANTFVSGVKLAHRWLGFIHAMYMAGCMLGPLIANAIANSTSATPWYYFYALPLGLGVLNLALISMAFRNSITIQRPQTETPGDASTGELPSALETIVLTLSRPAVWVISLYFFFFLGAVITAGGWVSDYLIIVRNGNMNEMGYVPTGLYGGSFLGRLLLAEPTHRLGERRMIFIYAVLCVALQLVFWLVPNIIAEAVGISLMGFFSGPFFATGISVASKIFPTEIQSSGIGFVFVLGQVGGSVFPIVTGLVAARAGVKVLQPILVALLCATGVSWLLVPRKPRQYSE